MGPGPDREWIRYEPPAETLTLRGRMVPMIADAMERAVTLGLDVVAWDFVVVKENNALIGGFVCAVRGVELTGPMKEIARFEPFLSWSVDQNTVDRVVNTCLEALREFRARQARSLHSKSELPVGSLR